MALSLPFAMWVLIGTTLGTRVKQNLVETKLTVTHVELVLIKKCDYNLKTVERSHIQRCS